jgi:two-component system response regulator YesN
MIRMVIADDELLIRQGLRSIPWCDYGIELAGAAANGIEALELVRSEMPSILLTDIKMPGMDGLKLIEEARKIVPDIKSILLTGYQDFSYAQTAIQLRAIDYILKPSDPEEIIETVLKAKKQIEKEEQERLEKEKVLHQINCMQDIVRNAVKLKKLDIGEAEEPAEDGADPGAEQPAYPVRNAVIRQVIDYITRNYMNDITLTSVSQHVYMNHIYLSRLIKKETGENFLEILTRIRLQKACEMLSDPDMKAYEVAEMVGIRDAGYFSQVFRKYFGMTPSEYREKLIFQQQSDS